MPLTKAEYDEAMNKVCPHGPDEPCTQSHHKVGCTCDIDWEMIHNLKKEGWE